MHTWRKNQRDTDRETKREPELQRDTLTEREEY